MTITVASLAFLIFNFSLPFCFAETGFLAQQAELAWRDRAQPGQTEIAIKLWQQALKAEPNRKDLWIPIARAMGRAVRHGKTSADKRQWADRAKEAAEKAIQENPASAEAFGLYGEALGQWANAHKGIGSLKTVKKGIAALNHALELDPRNFYAHMLLSQYYRQSPRLLSVGDKEKALYHARLAVEYAPQYAIGHLALADALLDVGKKDDAILQLQGILALKAPPDVIPETAADQETARGMLKELGVPPPSTSGVSSTPLGDCDDSGMCTSTTTP